MRQPLVAHAARRDWRPRRISHHRRRAQTGL